MKKATRKAAPPIPAPLKTNANKSGSPKSGGPKKKANASKTSAPITPPPALPAPETGAPETGAPGTGAPRTGAEVLDRLHAVIIARRMADPAHSHSARLLARGPAKVAQKFGEEAVECLIEAVAGDAVALVAESADVLYHLLVMWVAAGVAPNQVWAELQRREGVSGVAEKAARLKPALGTRKIP